MNVYSVTGLCLCGALAVLVVREMKKEFVPALTVGIGLTVLIACLPTLSEASKLLDGVSGYIDSAYSGAVLRALGVAYLTTAASQISRSCGEQSVGEYIETAGKFEIIAISLPLLRELIAAAMLK